MSKEPEQLLQEDVEEIVIPVIEEELATGTHAVKTGSVRVDKHVEKRIRRIQTPLLQEEVEVRHVPVNRVVGELPRARKRGDTIIIPIVEEELVVTKRLVLKEEIHLIKRRTRDRVVKEVELNREHAEVRRLDPEGRVIDSRPTSDKRPGRIANRRGLLP
jgi:uncharacterized protein (TIGR02271 family)